MVLLVIGGWLLLGAIGAGLCALWWDLGWGRGACWREQRGLMLSTVLMGPATLGAAALLFLTGKAGAK